MYSQGNLMKVIPQLRAPLSQEASACIKWTKTSEPLAFLIMGILDMKYVLTMALDLVAFAFSYREHSLYCYCVFKEICLRRAYLSVSEHLDSLNMNNLFSSNPFSRRGEKNTLIWQLIHCYLVAPQFACRSFPSSPIATNVLLVLVWFGDCILLFSIS